MKILSRINHTVHSRLLTLLMLMYGIAIAFPKAGILMRTVNLGTVSLFSNEPIQLSLPLLLLAMILFNAGFSIRIFEMKKIFSVPFPLLIGLTANILAPFLFTLLAGFLGKLYWSDLTEVQNIVVGLAIIASMPIAGSSTAWVQNSNGNVALILGLVVCSTILSPLFSPLIFHSIGNITSGEFSESLHQLARQGASSFLIISVVAPSLLGIFLRAILKEDQALRLTPVFRFISLFTLLLINYSNAATSLPIAYQELDWDFLALVLAVTTTLCLFSFSIGWYIPKLLKLGHPERVSLTFALGMNNNGTGLVLASTALISHPLVLLPIISYNLGQQIIAGIFDSFWIKRSGSSETE